MNLSTGQPEPLASALQVSEAVGGEIVSGDPQTPCSEVSTDSRAKLAGALFIGLRGENFDGAHFASDAIAKGANIVLVEKKAYDEGKVGDTGSATVIVADDGLEALGALAAWHRRRFDCRVVGITGSNGKTSTKEMTAAVLGGEPAVLFNRGNFNNQVGMPRALLGLRKLHTHVVLEMGMNAPGEIARLASIAAPGIGVITNVHPVHLEGLGTIEAVARAKAELLQALSPDGVAIVNADDPLVLKMAEKTRARRITFGRQPNADVRITSMKQVAAILEVELSFHERSLGFRLSRPGLHNAMNAAAAAAVGWVEGIDETAMEERLGKAPLPDLRMENLRLGNGHLLVDCYNANPRSVQAALATLQGLAGEAKHFAVLGDMRELGDASADLHRQVGHSAAASGLHGLCAFGELAADIAYGARANGLDEILATEDVEQAMEWARERLQKGGWVLLKGSRAMRMERIAARLALSFGVDWREVED